MGRPEDLSTGDLIELWIIHNPSDIRCYIGMFLGMDSKSPNMGRILENGRLGLFNPQSCRFKVLANASNRHGTG